MTKEKWKFITEILIIFTLFACFSSLFGQENERWSIVLDTQLMEDEAIKLALNDLQKSGKKAGTKLQVFNSNQKFSDNSILVGSPLRNRYTKSLVQEGKIKLQGIEDSQGYEIVTTNVNGNKIMVVSGGSILGEVYGLYWILDRMKVFGRIPALNIKRIPEMKIRFTGGGTKEAMQNALRVSATWVNGGYSVNNLVPWDSEPEKTTNAKNREELRQLIEYAHRLHLKFFVYEDEFSYHPTLLEEFGATLSPEDPAFWDAVQAKYRRLLKAMPEIDGIRIRTGELTRIGGTYVPFDVMHDGDGCDWSLAKRYRTFVKKVYNVVVGEFDKIYFQRTWVTSAHEQHSMAEVYKNIFTDDIPVKNLYMSPYLSTTDRYFHQPYNPTFNLTPHNMILLLATLDYHSHSGVSTFPTFPGTYYQGGLETILASEKTNLKGFDFGTYAIPSNENWNTGAVTTYTIYRLAWNPREDIKEIVRDFTAMCFGRAAAAAMADIYLLSPNAYKYGIYIEPVSHGDFRSLPHLRLTTFPAKGLPRLDNGRKHIEFLRTIYLRCRPWINETLMYLDHGLNIADSMVVKFTQAKSLISDPKLAQNVDNAVNLTYWLIKTNNFYVKTFFAYFEYREKPSGGTKEKLVHRVSELKEAMAKFIKMPGCVYRLDGMIQLVKNVEQVLENLPKAEKILATAPDEEGTITIISDLQKKYVQILEDHKKDAVKILHWEARVDGRDLVKVKGGNLEVEHLRYDQITEMTYQFQNSLPQKQVTVIPVDIQSRSYGPFVLEQPSPKNDFTAVLYLSDYPRHGYSWWKFDLYYIQKSPEELGIIMPWQN
jgi:hypothetical protein